MSLRKNPIFYGRCRFLRLPATGPFPLPVGAWRGRVEEESRESESNPKVALAAQSYPHAHACPNHVDIHLGTYNPTRCPPKAPDITQNRTFFCPVYPDSLDRTNMKKTGLSGRKPDIWQPYV
ncbi:hypothetical protein TNCV_461651 [Trichonephila clavipes]|nr:hypothetical protein TNCV_461651 [Trichonephila clavipes]